MPGCRRFWRAGMRWYQASEAQLLSVSIDGVRTRSGLRRGSPLPAIAQAQALEHAVKAGK
jgi:hypothetical protein